MPDSNNRSTWINPVLIGVGLLVLVWLAIIGGHGRGGSAGSDSTTTHPSATSAPSTAP